MTYREPSTRCPDCQAFTPGHPEATKTVWQPCPTCDDTPVSRPPVWPGVIGLSDVTGKPLPIPPMPSRDMPPMWPVTALAVFLGLVAVAMLLILVGQIGKMI